MLFIIVLYSISSFGQQNADFYKQRIEECLSRGNCDDAQIMYDAWKEMTGTRDVEIESRIDACVASANSLADCVEINDVIWATRNVGESGRFVDNPEDYGNYFTFDEAQSVCPEGYRMPVTMDFQNLSMENHEWTSLNGVYGLKVGDDSVSIFLPASGVRKRPKGRIESMGSWGYYWSATVFGALDRQGEYLLFSGIISPPIVIPKGINLSMRASASVRCVKNK